MSPDTEFEISSEIYDEILRNTNKKTTMRLDERVLRKTMVALVKSGHASFLFLRDDESRDWWSKVVKDASAVVEKRREARRIYEVKLKAWNRLTQADRTALGIRKPTPPRGI